MLPTGSRYEQKLSKDGIPQQIPRKDTCQYISIAETMRHIISIDGFINLFQAYKLDKSTGDFALCCIQDGFYYYSNPTFTAIDTITIELYIDDVELVNPLGSHTGIHKLGFVYFTIKDLPVSLQSSLGSIFLTNVHYSLDVEKYGYKAIFEPLIQDLKQLLDHGIEFRGNTYKIALWQILGDNLGLNKLFGFVECFSANFCCRFCLVHKNEMQKMFKEDNSLLRHKVGHDAYVRDVIDQNITTAMCGVKSDCPFNELGYWHVTNNLVVDVMHDLLEGWCATETHLILHQYIFKDKFLTLSVLNDRISNFNYGKCDSRCKPVPIKREKLLNLDGSNGQSASQMWVLVRILPLLIGDKVPYNNDFWNLYLLMLTIIDTLMAPVISLPETYALAENIADHHKLFLILFPNRYLTPKMHFALHYPRIIRQLGPPVRYWSMRYENKHYPSKKCASSSGNFLNVAKTVAVRHQLKMAHIFNKKNFKMPCITNILGSKYVQVCNSKQKELLCTIDGLTDQMEVITCNSLCYNGTVYSKNMAVLIGCVDDLPLFGKIKELFLHDNDAYLASSNFSSDSTVPPCNTDITYSSNNDSLTIFPHPICNISDLDASNVNNTNNQNNIGRDISLNYSEPLCSTPLPLSPGSTSTKKKINIREIIKLKLPDIFSKLEKGDPSSINILHKYRVNRLLVQTYIGNYDCKPSTKDKLDLAKDIVSTFPVLKGSDGEGYSWCKRCTTATGFLADRFKNFRARNLSVVEKEELGIGRISRNSKEKTQKYQGTEDSSVEFLQKQQWLKENTSPLDKVILLMQETFEGRRFEIARNATNFVSNWPRILDPHVIEAEFNMLYGEPKSDSLCLGFGMTANSIIHQAKHCGRKCAEEFANELNFDLNSTEPSSEKICCALILLPLLLPQRVFRRNGPKKLKIRPTSSQTLDHFIQFIPVGEGIDKFMKDDRLLGGERRQPFVLAIGEKCRPQQIFLIFEDNCIE
ncbi:uncharacterized protein LOC106175700, partial [Trichonephila inaurata madagascariensis]